MQKQENKQYAGFFVRFAAYLLDSLLVGILLLFLIIPMGIITLVSGENILTKPILFQYSIWAILIYLLKALYFSLCTCSCGQTIGKRAFQIKVISTGETEKLTFFNALYRETIGRFLSGLILYIGYFMIGPDKEKKALHDIICDTRVIYSVKVREEVILRNQFPYQGGNGFTGNQPPYQGGNGSEKKTEEKTD